MVFEISILLLVRVLHNVDICKSWVRKVGVFVKQRVLYRGFFFDYAFCSYSFKCKVSHP